MESEATVLPIERPRYERERVTGFEPVSSVWDTDILPLDDTRVEYLRRDSNPRRPGKSRVLCQ